MNSNELLIEEIKNQIDNLNKTYKDFSNNYKEQLSKLNNMLEEIKNKQDNNKLNEGEKYFYVSSYCETNDTAYNKDFFNDMNRINCGNWSHSRREIELRAKYISIYLKLQNFMRENDIKIDWSDKEVKKYFINYNYDSYNEEKSIFIDYNLRLVQSTFNFFTNTEEQCKKAIELYGDEIKEYFEELRCVDYGEYNNYDKEYTGN